MKNTQKRISRGFTLIELMAVITIIVVLAGLVVAGMGFVNERQARDKAKVQISLLSAALEEYKLDNGEYPSFPDSAGDGTGRTRDLFEALYLDGIQNDTKVYLADLDPLNNKQGWTVGTTSTTLTEIVDPWGNEYCYRSALDGSGGSNGGTQNPDFDLWSRGKDGVSEANDPSASADKNKDDIRNF